MKITDIYEDHSNYKPPLILYQISEVWEEQACYVSLLSLDHEVCNEDKISTWFMFVKL